ncbi:transposase, partial [Escherichia fergusonii]|uniref:transposase n=1 Tax=Escherichia fergusonii TaxID=564 RepID=UPI00209A8DFD
WLHNNKGRLTRGCNPTSSKFIHTWLRFGEIMRGSLRVEHPFRIIKRQFGFVKARYKGLLKNDNQLAMLFTLANLFRVDQMIRQWERSQ